MKMRCVSASLCEYYLVVLEEEEGLDECEDEVQDVHDCEDLALARGRVVRLEVRRDVEPVQGDTANAERWKQTVRINSRHRQ